MLGLKMMDRKLDQWLVGWASPPRSLGLPSSPLPPAEKEFWDYSTCVLELPIKASLGRSLCLLKDRANISANASCEGSSWDLSGGSPFSASLARKIY